MRHTAAPVGLLIAAAGITFRTSFFHILPLFISLFISNLPSRASRYALRGSSGSGETKEKQPSGLFFRSFSAQSREKRKQSYALRAFRPCDGGGHRWLKRAHAVHGLRHSEQKISGSPFLSEIPVLSAQLYFTNFAIIFSSDFCIPEEVDLQKEENSTLSNRMERPM
jgi:hypothetical protein